MRSMQYFPPSTIRIHRSHPSVAWIKTFNKMPLSKKDDYKVIRVTSISKTTHALAFTSLLSNELGEELLTYLNLRDISRAMLRLLCRVVLGCDSWVCFARADVFFFISSSEITRTPTPPCLLLISLSASLLPHFKIRVIKAAVFNSAKL